MDARTVAVMYKVWAYTNGDILYFQKARFVCQQYKFVILSN